MLLIKENYRASQDHLALMEEHFEEPLAILDIETTGFSRKHAKIMLIGIIVKRGPELKLFQLFDDTGAGERELLEGLFRLVQSEEIKTFITYNGHSFDFPFINARAKVHGLENRLMNGFNVDLYRLVRTHAASLSLQDYKLKSIERFLGIERADQISGKESIESYRTYLRSRSETLREEILLHNREDIQYLVPLIGLLDHLPVGSIDAFVPITLELQEKRLALVHPRLKGDYLHVTLESSAPLKGMVRVFTETFQIETIDRHRLRVQVATAAHHTGDHLLTFLNPGPITGSSYSELDAGARKSLVCAVNGELILPSITDALTQLLNRQVWRT